MLDLVWGPRFLSPAWKWTRKMLWVLSLLTLHPVTKWTWRYNMFGCNCCKITQTRDRQQRDYIFHHRSDVAGHHPCSGFPWLAKRRSGQWGTTSSKSNWAALCSGAQIPVSAVGSSMVETLDTEAGRPSKAAQKSPPSLPPLLLGCSWSRKTHQGWAGTLAKQEGRERHGLARSSKLWEAGCGSKKTQQGCPSPSPPAGSEGGWAYSWGCRPHQLS